jgi:hypothetical protein
MEERGKLIRGELTNEFRALLPGVKSDLDPMFDDLAVEGSDGIGRKTEAPWVRVFSKSMSPTARDGFYFVVHFEANGSAVYFTIGCGSTIWHGGDLTPVSPAELTRRTAWAKDVLLERWGSLEPFIDQISLGAKAPLPRTFEQATAVAHRIAVQEIDSTNLVGLFKQAILRLAEIYRAQASRRDVSQGEQDADLLREIAQPAKQKRRSQGRGLSGPERKMVELHAMGRAAEYLESLGYSHEDRSAEDSFDFLARKGSKELKVEVKGTTSDLCDSVLMTKNEVNLHRSQKGSTALIIVSQIRLTRGEPGPTTEGGKIEAFLEWDIDSWSTDAIAFQVSKRR